MDEEGALAAAQAVSKNDSNVAAVSGSAGGVGAPSNNSNKKRNSTKVATCQQALIPNIEVRRATLKHEQSGTQEDLAVDVCDK